MTAAFAAAGAPAAAAEAVLAISGGELVACSRLLFNAEWIAAAAAAAVELSLRSDSARTAASVRVCE